MVNRPGQKEMLSKFFDRSHQVGLTVTLPRQVVYESLIARTDHPTADMLYQSVHQRSPQISRSSVFRILDTLAAKGLIFKVMHPGSASRYDGVADGHAHLVCTGCGQIYDWWIPTFGMTDVDGELPDGFQVTGLTVCYQGLCRTCQHSSERQHTPERQCTSGQQGTTTGVEENVSATCPVNEEEETGVPIVIGG